MSGRAFHDLLLLAYPRRFRSRHGSAMRRLFAGRWRAARARGVAAAALFLAASTLDALVSGTLERLLTARDWILFPHASTALARLEQERRPMFWQATLSDLRYALRLFARTPTFTGLTVLTLALGIGANSAIFSVVNAVLLKPLPYATPDRLVMVWNDNTREGVAQYPMSPANFLDVKAAATKLDRLEMMYSFLNSGRLRTDAGSEQIVASGTTPGMFDLLGQAAALGRTLRPSDGEEAIVLSDGFWRRRFGADPAIVGRRLIVEDEPVTVVGVMPPGFHFPLKTMLGPSGFSDRVEPDAWIPLDASGPRFQRDGQPIRSVHYLSVVGRLAPGVTLEEARLEVSAIVRRLEEQYPDVNRGLQANVVGLHDQAVGSVRPALLLLLAGVGVVLLMACVNVANLLLARSAGRRKELAVRAALGAARSRLLAQMLAESVLLALAGGLAGIAVAFAGVQALVAIAPPELPRLGEVRPDTTVLLFTLAVSLLAGILVGSVPAVAAWRGQTQNGLRDTSRSVAGSAHRRMRAALVAGEVALAVVLATGAGLLFRSFTAVLEVDPGFRAENLLTMQVSLPGHLRSSEARVAFYRELFERLEALPGVVSAGGTTRLPLGSTSVTTRVVIEGRGLAPGDAPEVEFRRAMHDYFSAMGVPVLRGRTFTDADLPGSPSVVVINETMARRIWPGEDPVGRRLRFGTDTQSPWSTVVGVVGDLRHAGLEQEPAAECYIWYLQGPPVAPFLVVRTRNDPAGLADAVRAEFRSLDKELTLYDLRTMTEVRAASVAARRFVLLLALAFGALALTLAAVGVYGVMAIVVAERTQELGIRLALGAEPIRLLGLVVRRGLLLAGAGIAAGLAVSISTTPLMSSQLYGIGPADPLTLGSTPLLLLLVALLACAIPAQRAMRVDPVTSLRDE